MLTLHMAGSEAILADVSDGPFNPGIQRRVWSFARHMGKLDMAVQVVPGVNNVLVTFDSAAVSGEEIEALIRDMWEAAPADTVSATEVVEVPVRYGGAEGADLATIAEVCGLSVGEVIARHSAAEYSVAAVGAMPGFVYLTGLAPSLSIPRRSTPRLNVPKGAVIIGGGHAGVMPCTAPSGWHILGMTDLELFSLDRPDPLLLHPGDIVRFRPVED